MAFGTFIFTSYIFNNRLEGKTAVVSVGLFTTILICAVGLLLRANQFVIGLLVIVIFTTVLLQLYLAGSRIPMVRSLLEFILAPLYFVGSYIKHFFKTIRIVLRGEMKGILPAATVGDNKKNITRSIVLGLFIGFFVIGILISMFSSADPIFASFIKRVLSVKFLQTLYQRVILSSVIGAILLPLTIFSRDSVFNSPLRLFKRWHFLHEMSVVMVLVAIVMGIFLIIQWPYVFANVAYETDLSTYGVATYSEYVRKGFIELLKVALFVYGLIWIGLIVLRERKPEEKTILPYIQFVVLVEFFIFVVSIFRRVWLYQSYHGWSLVRIYGSVFLIWILGITLFLVFRHFWHKRWVIGELIFTVIVVFFIGILNIEKFIVTNHPPTVNKQIDYVYLSRLSADGYIGWLQSYNYAQDIIEKYNLKSGPLTKDDRRKIAYAGIVIKELSRNYNDLIKDYGSYNEKKQYINSIFVFQKEANNLTIARRKEKHPQEQIDLNFYYKNIDELQKMLNADRFDQDKIFNAFYIADYEEKYKFNMGSEYTIPSFYDLSYFDYSRVKTEKKDDSSMLDQIYVLNNSRLTGYQMMKRDIRYNNLIKLQKKYFQLYRKISLQPPDQRDYEMDISLRSPLVD